MKLFYFGWIVICYVHFLIFIQASFLRMDVDHRQLLLYMVPFTFVTLGLYTLLYAIYTEPLKSEHYTIPDLWCCGEICKYQYEVDNIVVCVCVICMSKILYPRFNVCAV